MFPIIFLQLYLVFTIFVLESISEEVCDFNFKVKQNLYNDGFHRNLSYVIHWVSQDPKRSWVDDEACSVAMELVLPAGVYASPDEVRNYHNEHFKTVLFKNPVDIELPANTATPITMHLLLNAIDNKILFSLPVHARYYPAVPGGGKARNEILPPRMYLKCLDERLHKCEKIKKGISRINNFCNQDSLEMCPWKEIPATVITDRVLWEVPVGNSNHFTVVAIGTALTVVFSSFCLLMNILNFKKNRIRVDYKNK